MLAIPLPAFPERPAGVGKLGLVADIAAQVVGVLSDQAGDTCTTGDTGKVADRAQFARLREDFFGRVGIGGRGARVENHRRTRCHAWLDITFDNDDAVVSVYRRGEHLSPVRIPISRGGYRRCLQVSRQFLL